jgi:phosphomannomutase/phosphoglucomutase
MKQGDLRKSVPYGVALLLLLAGWFAWSGYVQWRHQGLVTRIQQVRDQAVEDFSKAIAAQNQLLDKLLKDEAVVRIMAGGDAVVAAEAIAKRFAAAEQVKLFPVNLTDVYVQAAKFGYGRLALLESALAAPGVRARVVLDEAQPRLGLAATARLADAPALVYVRLPLRTLTTALDAVVVPKGAYVALRQGNYNVIEKGDSELSGRSESLAIPVGKTGLRVAIGVVDVDVGPLGLGALACLIVAVLFLLVAAVAVLALVGRIRLPLRKVAVAENHALTLKEILQNEAKLSAAVASKRADVHDAEVAASPIASQLDAEIFRTTGITGVVGCQLNAAVATQIGQAIGSQILAVGLQELVVGFDGRTSSPELAAALIEGVRSTGCDVVDVGMSPTPVIYYAANELQLGCCVAVTGSHNAAEYNGFTIVLAGQPLAGAAITELYRRIVDGRLVRASSVGGLEHRPDIADRYIRSIVNDIQLARPLKIVADAGNGVAGEIVPSLLEAIGAEIIPLYCDVDGSFSNHRPDPSEANNLSDLIQTVKRFDADLGIAFDGDGDRLAVVTHEGIIISADRLLMLFASDVLQRNPGALVIYDANCTGKLARHILRCGGSPMMCKAGHWSIKTKMRETGAELAGEISGHFYFRERWYGFDDGMYAAARLIEILAQNPQPPSQVLNALPSGFATPAISLRLDVPVTELVEDFSAAVKSQATGFENALISLIDGLRADFADGWGLLRADSAADVLVLRFEGETPEALKRIRTLFRTQLQILLPDHTFEF